MKKTTYFVRIPCDGGLIDSAQFDTPPEAIAYADRLAETTTIPRFQMRIMVRHTETSDKEFCV